MVRLRFQADLFIKLALLPTSHLLGIPCNCFSIPRRKGLLEGKEFSVRCLLSGYS